MTDSVKNEIHPNVQLACDIAMGRTPSDPDSEGYLVGGAHKDYSARGSCRAHWFRMVLRNGQWNYVSDDYLPSGNFRASERNATVYGEVFVGEIHARHDRGKQFDDVGWIVTVNPDDPSKPIMVDCPIRKCRDGSLKIELPSGDVVKCPNPRAKS